MARRRPKGLSDDDLAVWRQVARSTAPLHTEPKSKPKPPEDAAVLPPPLETPADPGTPGLTPFRLGETARPKDPGHWRAPSPGQALSAMPVSMDAKTHKKMRRGKLKPEAKLDLHGMTLAQAHPALIGFIHRAYGDGLRLVLVVTGKGKDRDTPGPIPVPRGILRHNVPQWLQSGPLRPMVLQVTDAHVRHGGGGAYYVYLRRGA